MSYSDNTSSDNVCPLASLQLAWAQHQGLRAPHISKRRRCHWKGRATITLHGIMRMWARKILHASEGRKLLIGMRLATCPRARAHHPSNYFACYSGSVCFRESSRYFFVSVDRSNTICKRLNHVLSLLPTSSSSRNSAGVILAQNH